MADAPRHARAPPRRLTVCSPVRPTHVPWPPLCSKLPCYDFMYCTAAEGPIFKRFAELEMLETL
jgi:hypothetical protein